MKTHYFLFTVVGCAVLMSSANYAGPPSVTSEQQPSASADAIFSDHPRNAKPIQQLGSSLPAAVARDRLVGKKTVNTSTSLSHSPTSAPLAGSSLKSAGNRGPNLPTIGGPATSMKKPVRITGGSMSPTRNTAVINGTGINRKP